LACVRKRPSKDAQENINVKPFVLSLLAVALVASSTMRLAAKDDAPVQDSSAKPVAVLTIASYERLMSDIAFVGNLAGSPDLDKNLEGMIQLFTQGQGLNGLDKKRPLGITLTTDGTQFQPLVVLPVTNLKTLLEALAGLIGEAQDNGNGVFELNVFNQKVFVKEKNGWAFVGQTTEALESVPKDPTQLFGGLEKSYDVAARLYVQNVPELYRTLLIDQMRMGVEASLSRQTDESDEAFESRKKMVATQIEALSKAINDVDQLTLGVALDTKLKNAHIDLSVSVLPGSDSAKQIAQVQSGTSDFAGFLVPEAAASLNLTAKIEKTQGDQIVTALKTFREQTLKHIETNDKLTDESSKKLAKEMVGQVFDAIDATIESGKIDAGATLNLSDKAMALVVGAYVADPKPLEDALKKFAKLAEKEPNFPGIKFDADKHGNVRFHTATIPVPESEEISKVLGTKLDVGVGIGPKSIYLAVGTDSLALCKTLIDKSKADAGKQVPPFQLNVSLAPIFQFAAAMHPEPTLAAMAKDLAEAKGKDHVSLVVSPEPNAIKIRLMAEEGVLQLLGTAFKNAQAGGGIPGLGN
jgi:hypothetical protein